jgi:hypothetical protein
MNRTGNPVKNSNHLPASELQRLPAVVVQVLGMQRGLCMTISFLPKVITSEISPSRVMGQGESTLQGQTMELQRSPEESWV